MKGKLESEFKTAKDLAKMYNDKQLEWAAIVLDKDRLLNDKDIEIINLKAEINKKDMLIRDMSRQLTDKENFIEKQIR
jgi:hypothetical protein